MSWLPEDMKDAAPGETIDHVARDSIRLAHKALERFPDLVRRHKIIAGGAAISSSLVILAGVAIARRMRRGESPDEAIARLTEHELEFPDPERRPRNPATNGLKEEAPPARVD
jgi:hypothetical protein